MSSDRIYLRPAERGDAEIIAEHWHDESYLSIIDGGRVPVSPIEIAWQIDVQHKQQPPEFIELAACLRESDLFIGNFGLWHIDWTNRTAETGSHLGPDYRDKGYGTEAKHLMLKYAFDVLQLHMIWSTVWEPNQRSAAALIKQGYQPAGRFKWSGIQDGSYHDMLLFDLTRDDWQTAYEIWLTKLFDDG